MSHGIGDGFCLLDAASIRAIDLDGSAVGASLAATAHGIGDVAPLPKAERLISGEALRPPSPCHLKLLRSGNVIIANWVRRSHKGWNWVDGVGVGNDSFSERYRLTLSGPLGVAVSFTRSAPQHGRRDRPPGSD